jgi:hypothetical protein
MLDFVSDIAVAAYVGILVLCALGCFLFFIRTRFWFPTYAHVLAVTGLAIGIWCVATIPDTAPINDHDPIGKILLVLAMPAMVYFFFVFYGGQRAAFRRQLGTSGHCPHCKEPVVQPEALQTRNEPVLAPAKCPHCGLNLA